MALRIMTSLSSRVLGSNNCREGVMMDVVHDRTNIIVEEDEDRIRNSPDDIIHRIQLSRKWKHIWTSMPHLRLNSRLFRSVQQFAKFVDQVLSHRNNETEVCEVELTFTGPTTQHFVENIVNYAYLHNVKKLTLISISRKSHAVPQYLFSSNTLKHLTLHDQSGGYHEICLPTFGWDFPALETLSLSNMFLGDREDRSVKLFSKCVNLKDLTLHRVTMYLVEVVNIFCPELVNLTITDVIRFPEVFNVVAPKLKNLTATVGAIYHYLDISFDCLQSTEGFNSLEKVNLFLSPGSNRINEIGVPVLLSLFQKLCSAKVLILNSEIIETLGSDMDQLLHQPSPFNNLKCLMKDRISRIAIQVSRYLLENSPNATFYMDLHQKRPWEQLYKEAKSKMAKLEEKIQRQDEVITEQNSVHEKLLSQILTCKIAELRVQVEGGNPDYNVICSVGHDIKIAMDLIPRKLRSNLEAQFFCQYEELKSLFFTRISAAQWENIEIELGSIRYSERTHSTNSPSQSNVNASELRLMPRLSSVDARFESFQ